VKTVLAFKHKINISHPRHSSYLWWPPVWHLTICTNANNKNIKYSQISVTIHFIKIYSIGSFEHLNTDLEIGGEFGGSFKDNLLNANLTSPEVPILNYTVAFKRNFHFHYTPYMYNAIKALKKLQCEVYFIQCHHCHDHIIWNSPHCKMYECLSNIFIHSNKKCIFIEKKIIQVIPCERNQNEF